MRNSFCYLCSYGYRHRLRYRLSHCRHRLSKAKLQALTSCKLAPLHRKKLSHQRMHPVAQRLLRLLHPLQQIYPQQFRLRLFQILLIHPRLRLRPGRRYPIPNYWRCRKQPQQTRQHFRRLTQRLPAHLKRRRHAQRCRHFWMRLHQRLRRQPLTRQPLQQLRDRKLGPLLQMPAHQLNPQWQASYPPAQPLRLRQLCLNSRCTCQTCQQFQRRPWHQHLQRQPLSHWQYRRPRRQQHPKAPVTHAFAGQHRL